MTPPKKKRDRRAYLRLGDQRLFQVWMSADLKALLDVVAEEKQRTTSAKCSTSALVRRFIWEGLQKHASKAQLDHYKRNAWKKDKAA
jgi:hypothetical protein